MLKEKYEALDLIKLAEVLRNVLWNTENQELNVYSLKNLGKIGFKIVLHLIMQDWGDFDFEYRNQIGDIVPEIATEL